MYRLPPVILLLFGVLGLFAQSPHGDDLTIECGQCHNPTSWEVDVLDEFPFDHDEETSFELEGMHAQIDCIMCHESLVFDEAPADCMSCHTDVHSNSVGNDCVRCHTADSWLVDNIPELHEANGFPLMGAHGNLSCVECHLDETNIRFDRIGNECISCHNEDYVNTENPDHKAVGYSIECVECHSPLAFDWSADPISHDFFPLELGHDIQDCNACHTPNDFTGLSSDCIVCHQMDYDQTSNPSHQELGFNTDCASCHTLNPGWAPATFDHDGLYFPIYSGTHPGNLERLYRLSY